MPSENLTALAELQQNKSENEAPASSSSSINIFRVKNVSEINENANAVDGDLVDDCESNSKRKKLPSWMLSANDETEIDDNQNNSKRLRSESFDQQHNSCTSTSTGKTDGCPITNDESDLRTGPSSNSFEVKAENPKPMDVASDSSTNQQSGTTNPRDIKPAVNVKKEEATSTSRESCKFGIRCYRRNPMHRIEEAHPGDHDYRRPNFPTPPKGTPDCPFGDSCYRRNPIHFQQYYHPADTDFEQNWKNYRMRLRQRRQTQNNSATNNDDNSDLDDYDLDDPFIDDDDDDYIPSDDEDADYDDCDKAEE